MTTSSFSVWIRPGRKPVWGDLEVVQQRACSIDQYEITVRGDGVDLEQLVRSNPDAFVMFERLDDGRRGLSLAP